jgi:hypothetical protein
LSFIFKWTEGGADENLIYWEQYTIPGPITLRRGDHVLVRGENNRNMIAQIDTMWTGQECHKSRLCYVHFFTFYWISCLFAYKVSALPVP